MRNKETTDRIQRRAFRGTLDRLADYVVCGLITTPRARLLNAMAIPVKAALLNLVDPLQDLIREALNYEE